MPTFRKVRFSILLGGVVGKKETLGIRQGLQRVLDIRKKINDIFIVIMLGHLG